MLLLSAATATESVSAINAAARANTLNVDHSSLKKFFITASLFKSANTVLEYAFESRC